jgi:putative drug exporter of the RND superfamily
VSLRRRLVATLLVLVVLGLAAADVGTYVALRSFLLDRVDRQVKTVTDLVEAYAASHEAKRTHFFDPDTPTMFGKDTGDTTVFKVLAAGGVAPSFLQLRYPDNRVMKTLSWGAPAPRLPAVLPVSTSPGAGPDGAVAFTVPSEQRGGDRRGGGGQWRVRAVRLPGSGGYLLAMATPTRDVQATLGRLRQVEAAVGLLVLIGVALLARRAVRRGMRPLEEIGETARAIGAGELDRRVEPADARTEVGRLGLALNAMLHQLETAFQRRRASEERLRRFVADASHELRTPLTSIRGYAELFRRGASANPDDLAKAMRRIEAEATRMGALVDELLLLARLDQGRPLERAPVDLAALAAEAVADARAVEPDRPVTLERDGPVVVRGDADRLRQVLANLVANVRQHTPPASPMRVRASLADQGWTAVLEVADRGPGLAAEQRERVFERFWRADRSRLRAGEGGQPHGGAGAGLGLSIVAAVAAAHGGRATVESVQGQGTTFRVELPLDGPLDRRTATSKVPHRLVEGAVGEVGPASPTDYHEERGFMATLSRFVLRHKRLVGLFWLAVLVAGLASSSRVSNRLSTEFSLPGEKSYQAAVAIKRLYGNGGDAQPLVPVVTLSAGTTVDSPGVKQALARSFATVARTAGARAVSYGDTGDRRFVSPDARVTFGLVFVPGSFGPNAPDLGPTVAQALQRSLPSGATVHVTGLDELANGGSGGGEGKSVLAETLLGGIGALAVLAFVFGSLLAFMPLLIAAVSILTALLVILGLTSFTDVSFIVQYLVALIGLGVAIDYSLLIVTRWREERAHGYQGDQAVTRAMATAGRAVLFSGLTVAIGLLALVLLPIPFLRSVGYGGMLIPLVSVLVAVTLLPVLLAGVGRRIDWPRLRKEAHAGHGWTAWARGVVRLRWAAALAAAAVLAALGVAAMGIRIGEPKADSLGKSGSAYQGLVGLEHAGVPTGVLTPMDVLVPAGTDPTQVATRLAAVPGVRAAYAPTAPEWRREGTAMVTVEPVAEASTAAGKQTVRRVRDAAAAMPGVQVAGSGPGLIDGTSAIYGRFPLMLSLIALVTFVLLARAFRSILLPLKAVLLNLVSLGAAYGVLVLVWQQGHGSNAIWGIPATGSITIWIPLMVFAFLYGLSMDYEVFILARMREEYDHTGSTTDAITVGIGRTGRLVTSAALILFLAFASLASAPGTELKILASGLGAGILLDATLVRALLVPALVSLLGRWNWWLPPWAARLLRVEPSPARREAERLPALEDQDVEAAAR